MSDGFTVVTVSDALYANTVSDATAGLTGAEGAASSVQAMWSGRAGAGLARGMARGAGGALAQRFETELGYGFVGRKARGLWTPFLAAESGDGNAAYRLGLKLGSAANAESAFEFGRRESVGGPPDDEVRLQGPMRW